MKPPPAILLATANPHKLDELRAVFADFGVPVESLADVPGGRDIPEPEETGETFEHNARIKAVAYADATRRVCLADDSGLCVDAIAGAPGVHSAYYAHGPGTTAPRHLRDAANNDKLLRSLADTPDDRRAARFVCCMCAAEPGGRVLAISRGELPGRIARAPRGVGGFGYDPLLILPDGRTSAELSPDEKNRLSHRAIAARSIAPRLAALLNLMR